LDTHSSDSNAARTRHTVECTINVTTTIVINVSLHIIIITFINVILDESEQSSLFLIHFTFVHSTSIIPAGV
jgi:hypothetical protein